MNDSSIKVKEKRRKRMFNALMEVCNGASESLNTSTTGHHTTAYHGLVTQPVGRKMNRFINSGDSDKREDCRSLLCDSNNIIIAEMIYRCMVCGAVHELAADARLHYHQQHFQQHSNLPQSSVSNHLQPLRSDEDLDPGEEDEEDSEEVTEEIEAEAEDENDFEATTDLRPIVDHCSDDQFSNKTTNVASGRVSSRAESRMSVDSGTFGTPTQFAYEAGEEGVDFRSTSVAETSFDDKGNQTFNNADFGITVVDSSDEPLLVDACQSKSLQNFPSVDAACKDIKLNVDSAVSLSPSSRSLNQPLRTSTPIGYTMQSMYLSPTTTQLLPTQMDPLACSKSGLELLAESCWPQHFNKLTRDALFAMHELLAKKQLQDQLLEIVSTSTTCPTPAQQPNLLPALTSAQTNKQNFKHEYKPQLSCTRSGYITCPVCNMNRYYSTLQRRYGAFSCVCCYRFFKEFFLHPRRFECSNLSKCPLNVKNKCRACWIIACARVYSVDPKREAILSANQPVHTGQEIDSDLNETKSSQTNSSCSLDCSQQIQSNSPSSPLSIEQPADLLSSAAILQQILEQNKSRSSLPASSESGSFYHPDFPSPNCTSESYSINDQSLSYVHKPGSTNHLNEMTFNSSHMYQTAGLSGVAAVAAAAAAVESAGAQQQRLNEALCAEMLMKLETVAAQRNTSKPAEMGAIEQSDHKINLKEDDFGEEELVIDVLHHDDEHPQMTIELQTNQSNDSGDHQSNGSSNGEKIVPLENSMFVNLLPDLESIGIVSGAETIKKSVNTFTKLVAQEERNASVRAQDNSQLSTNQSKRGRKSRSSTDPNVAGSTIKKSKARVKNWCCLQCSQCRLDDCGKCINCLDRPKFGGPFIRKQRCINKRCLMKGTKLNRNSGIQINPILMGEKSSSNVDSASQLLNGFAAKID